MGPEPKGERQGMQHELERDETGYISLRVAGELLGYETRSFSDRRVLERLGLQLFRIAGSGALRLRRRDVLALVQPVEVK